MSDLCSGSGVYNFSGSCSGRLCGLNIRQFSHYLLDVTSGALGTSLLNTNVVVVVAVVVVLYFSNG